GLGRLRDKFHKVGTNGCNLLCSLVNRSRVRRCHERVEAAHAPLENDNITRAAREENPSWRKPHSTSYSAPRGSRGTNRCAEQSTSKSRSSSTMAPISAVVRFGSTIAEKVPCRPRRSTETPSAEPRCAVRPSAYFTRIFLPGDKPNCLTTASGNTSLEAPESTTP